MNAPVLEVRRPAVPPRPAFAVKPWHLLALHLLALLVVAAPLAAAQYPPLADYPNHLARIHVLAHLGQDPLLAERYAANWSVLPNLAVDALLVPLARLISVYDLGRIFVVASVLVFAGGALALFRAVQGRLTPWSLAIYAFVPNHVLGWGFLNCYLGLGLALFACAAWLRTEERWRDRWRVPVFSAVAVGLFFTHVIALAAYGLFVGARLVAITAARREAAFGTHARRWIATGVQFLAPMALWAASATGARDAVTIYGHPLAKLASIASMTVFHNESSGVALFLLFAVALVVGLASRSLQLAPRMGWPLLAMALISVAMPQWLFSTWGADFRLPPVLGVMLVAGVVVKRRIRLFTDVVVLMGVALIGARAWWMMSTVAEKDRQVAELRAAYARHLPKGSSLLIAQARRKEDLEPKGSPMRFTSAYWHWGAYAVIDRSAYVPIIFTDPEKQPLRVTDAYHWIDTYSGHPVETHELVRGASGPWADRMFGRADAVGRQTFFAYWPTYYDYVLYLRHSDLPNPAPDRLDLVAKGDAFALYRVRKQKN